MCRSSAATACLSKPLLRSGGNHLCRKMIAEHEIITKRGYNCAQILTGRRRRLAPNQQFRFISDTSAPNTAPNARSTIDPFSIKQSLTNTCFLAPSFYHMFETIYYIIISWAINSRSGCVCSYSESYFVNLYVTNLLPSRFSFPKSESLLASLLSQLFFLQT